MVLRWLCIFCLASTAHGLALPSSELVNRRKSPALWREDLHHEDDPVRPRRPKQPPEVMSPCGGWAQLHAAIGNGADSVYIGLTAFSARARAANFDPVQELPQAVELAHSAGVKVYVALNTLVFDHELEEVEDLVRKCALAKVDAIIVQDLGVARMAQRIAPSLEVHASTQQTITSADGAAFCAELLNSTRVVLGRELSIKEIDSVAAHLEEGIEIETFVHGALCVSYSGQCFSSEAWGGRSANRGQCAQSCRLPYGLIDNGELKELGDFSYLLSPQDLCGIDQVPGLLEAGVSCLKIEGRLKDAAYVAATTRAYRNAVDQAWQEYCDKNGVQATPRRRVLPEEVSRQELAQVFSRGQDEANNGLTPGFFEGSLHQMLVRGRSPRHRGVHVGRVEEVSSPKGGLVVQTDMSKHLKLGDGIVVDRGLAQEQELGGAIFELYETSNGRVVIHFSHDVESKWKKYDDNSRKGIGSGLPLAPAGAHVWKTSDAAVDKKMKRLSEAAPPRNIATVRVSGSLGERLRVEIDDGLGRIGVGRTEGELTLAERAGFSDTVIKKAVGTLGNTQWAIGGDEIDISGLDDGTWCPNSWIKEARRQAVQDLEAQCNAQGADPVDMELQYNIAENLLDEVREKSTNDNGTSEAKLSVLARNIDQVEALCRMAELGEDINEIIVDFLEVDGMREAVARIRKTGVRIIVASPRIIKPGESGIWRTLLRLEPDALLVRSTGLLYRMMKLGGQGSIVNVGSDGEEINVKVPELNGDFSLNVANALTAWELLQYGCDRVTASYDINANTITELLEALGGANARRVEVVAHCHMPIFHTEHCVFARFLSNGNSYLDCGHVCTGHNVHLRDQTGADNLVLADMGCRNTVFAAQAQSGAHSIKDWVKAGASHFRVELVDESQEDTELVVSGYLELLAGKIKANSLWESLEDVHDSNGRKAGVSFGSFRNGAERRAGEIV
jgi:putative protease